MNEKFEDWNTKLTQEIFETTLDFFSKNVKQEEDISFIIDLILSSHVSACCRMMKAVSHHEKKVSNSVDCFIKDLVKALSNIEPIKLVEYMESKSKNLS